MKASAIAVVMVLIMSTKAGAGGWTFFENEDPISDERTGVVALLTSDIGISFKCWKGDPKETLFMILTKDEYRDDSQLTVKVRTDKNTVREIEMSGRNTLQKQSFVGVAGIDEDVPALLNELKSAKNRLVVAIDSHVHTVSLTGASKAVSKMSETCGL